MKKILVGVDGSQRTTFVLSEAKALAEKTGAKIVLYRAVGLPPDVPTDLWKTSELDLGTVLVRNAKRDLEELAKTVAPAILDSTLVELGTGWDGICHAAKRLGVDMIMIGSHGYGGLDRLLGTTAARVVNHADRTVMVVRQPQSS